VSPALRPALRAGRTSALARGFVAFVAVAAIGQALALAVWAVSDTGASLGTFARIGWMYVGAFHHVAIELDVPNLEVPAAAAGPGATGVSVGVALLSITAIAVWLLFRAGRDVAEGVGGGTVSRVVRGASVAPSYAIPLLVAALVVEVRTPFRFGSFATGAVHVSLSTWQALAYPLAIAAAAGAAGGLRSALDAAPRPTTVHAAVAGGWRMLWLGGALSIAGLFVAGVVQPDGPAALLTPSTARYLRAVFERPVAGVVALGHHAALAPNEAVWTLVPAMGACDGVRGSVDGDVLCYLRFPTSVGTAAQPVAGGESVVVPLGGATYGTAPPPYFLFLAVPAAATVLGGLRAAERLGARGRSAALAGAAAGAVFAALVAVVSVASSVTVGYGAAFGADAAAGWLIAGPDPLAGSALALAWGVAGGAAGAAARGRWRSITSWRSTRPATGRAPR
jgi:hypothetical protein